MHWFMARENGEKEIKMEWPKEASLGSRAHQIFDGEIRVS